MNMYWPLLCTRQCIRFWEDKRKRRGLYPWVFGQLRTPSRLALQGSSSDRCPLVLWMYLYTHTDTDTDTDTHTHTHTPLGQPRCVSWSEYKLMQFSHGKASWLMTHDLVFFFFNIPFIFIRMDWVMLFILTAPKSLWFKITNDYFSKSCASTAGWLWLFTLEWCTGRLLKITSIWNIFVTVQKKHRHLLALRRSAYKRSCHFHSILLEKASAMPEINRIEKDNPA